MFETTDGRELFQALKSAVPAAMGDEHAMLRAYFTFLLSRRETDSGFYSDLNDNELQLLIFPELLGSRYSDLRNRFLQYSVMEFLRFFCPMENISGRIEFGNMDRVKSKFGFRSDLDYIANVYFNKSPKVDYKKVVKSKASRKLVWDGYNQITKEFKMTRIRTPENYYDFIYALYSFKLEGDSTKLSYVGKNTKDERIVLAPVHEAVRILFDKNRLSRDDVATNLLEIYRSCINCTNSMEVMQFLMSTDLLWNNASVSEIARTDGESEDEQVKLLEVLSKDVVEINTKNRWYDVLCSFHLSHRSRVDIRKSEIISSQYGPGRQNDVALEISLLYTLSTANRRKYKSRFLCIMPSPFFIEKWINDYELEDCYVDFVLEHQFCIEILRWFITKSLLSRNLHENEIAEFQKRIRFLDIHDIEMILADPSSSSYTDILINEPLVSEKHRSCLVGFFRGFRGENGCRIVDLCADVEMLDEGSVFSGMMNESICSIFLLPQGIGGTEPAVKNIWVADVGCEIVYDTCSTYILQRQTHMDKADEDNPDERRRVFCNADAPVEIDLDVYRNSGRPLREIAKTPGKFHAKEKSGSSGTFTYRFCEEIVFKYHRASVKDSPDKFNYYVSLNSGIKYVSEKRNETQLGLVHKPNNKTQEQFLCWIEHEYLDQIPPKDEKKRTVREIVADILGPKYRKAAITLKAFWVFNPDIKNRLKLSNRDVDILMAFVFNDSIGKRYLSEISEDDIRYFYEASEDDRLNVIYEVVLNAMSKVFDYARKLGHCHSNPLESVKIENTAMEKLRNALVKKSFSSAEFRNLYEKVKKGAEKGNAADLGILIRMVTGMTTSELRFLKWSNLVEIQGYGENVFHCIQVYRHMDSDGTVQNLPSPERIRLVPLGKTIGGLLASLKKAKKETEYILSSGQGNKPINEKTISDRLKKHITGLNIKDIKISVPKDRNGFVEMLITDYGGDILRSNYRYWAARFAAFTPDEIDAVLGLKRETTLGTFYIDYNNEQTLIYLSAKQSRLEAFLEDESSILCMTELKKIPDRIGGDGRYPLQMEIRGSCDCPVNMSIESRFGMNVSEYTIASREVKECISTEKDLKRK